MIAATGILVSNRILGEHSPNMIPDSLDRTSDDWLFRHSVSKQHKNIPTKPQHQDQGYHY